MQYKEKGYKVASKSYNVPKSTLQRKVKLARLNENQVQNVKVALGPMDTVFTEKTSYPVLLYGLNLQMADSGWKLNDRYNHESNLSTQRVELSGYTMPAPFALRPYAGLFNPYSYGCSVLCNHPMDNEAKDVVRRARDTWANEGRALLLPEEMEMIRTRLLAAARGVSAIEDSGYLDNKELNADAVAVPEELFRKYTETDSRPITPAPTLASVHATIPCNATQNGPPTIIYNPRERTTLVLDLRTNSQPQLDNGTFTWHALTLEVLPVSKKTGIVAKPVSRRRSLMSITRPPFALSSLQPEICETSLPKISDNDVNVGTDEPTITRRRGKKLRKRKYRRGSIYGQQTEVRDPLDPPETQISQTIDGSRRASAHAFTGDSCTVVSSEKTLIVLAHQTMHTSFIPAEILKHLCRELNRDKVEAEFSLKRKIAFEEALRVKGETHFALRGTRQTSVPPMQNIPRVFSRQAARFEILDSQSLCGITPLEYLSKYVHVSSGRKLIFGRAFIKFHEETVRGNRYISASDIQDALQDVIGRTLTDDRQTRFHSFFGKISEPLDFRTWCGVCAAAERLLCTLPPKEIDPPMWLERLDFNALERRLTPVNIDPRLARLLREIRDK